MNNPKQKEKKEDRFFKIWRFNVLIQLLVKCILNFSFGFSFLQRTKTI